MKIQILRAFDGHQINEVIECADEYGADAISSGWARGVVEKASLSTQQIIDTTIDALGEAGHLAGGKGSKQFKGYGNMGGNSATKGPWQNFGLYLRDIKAHDSTGGHCETVAAWDRQNKTAGHMTGGGGDDAQGGHMVPTGFSNQLLQTAVEQSFIRGRARYVPMETNVIEIPAIRDYSHENGIINTAMLIHRPGEGGTKTATKPHFDKVTLTLHKSVLLTYVSDELIEDSPVSIESTLFSLFGSAIAFTESNDFLNGSGVNMPLGVLHAPALISFARQPADGYISYLDLCTMWSRLHPASMPTSVWVVSPSLLPYLYTACTICTSDDDSDLSGHPVMLPSAGASESPYNTIFGRPVIISEHAQNAGTSGDIGLYDFQQYLIGGKSAGGAPKMDSSIHLAFDKDEVCFRAELRYDGQPWWQSPLTPKHGGATLSPFIALDDKT